jgi:hypothetical protein
LFDATGFYADIQSQIIPPWFNRQLHFVTRQMEIKCMKSVSYKMNPSTFSFM